MVKNVGLAAAREQVRKVLDMKYEPKDTTLSDPKHGKDDPENKPHTGGNTWSGGVRILLFRWSASTHLFADWRPRHSRNGRSRWLQAFIQGTQRQSGEELRCARRSHDVNASHRSPMLSRTTSLTRSKRRHVRWRDRNLLDDCRNSI